MERFKIIQSSAVFASYVKHYWLLESDDVVHSQRIIPSGNIELIFHRGNPMKCKNQIIPITSLSGQSLSFVDLIPTKVNMIAIVFHPFGAKAFLKLSVYELSNLIISADFKRAVKFYETILGLKLSICNSCENEKMAFFPKTSTKPNVAISWTANFHASKDGVLIHFHVKSITLH